MSSVSFFFVRRANSRDSKMTTRVTEGERRESRPRFSRLMVHSPTKSKEKLSRDCSQSSMRMDKGETGSFA